MKAFSDNFAAVLGMATVALLLMSLSHEYGYFWAVGKHFQIFVTTADYFSNAVLWLPTMLVILCIFLDWNVLLGKARYARLGLDWKGAFSFIALVSAPIIAFVFGRVYTPVAFIPVIILWLMYGTYILPFSNTESEILRHIHRALIVAPVVMVVLFSWGLAEGQRDVVSFNDPFTIDMKRGDRIYRILLRNFDKGILVRDAVDNRIELVRWDDIAKISRFAAPPSKTPLACSWFGIICGDYVSTP